MEYYATETKYYEENGKQFFEHESFYKYTPKVYVEKKEEWNRRRDNYSNALQLKALL